MKIGHQLKKSLFVSIMAIFLLSCSVNRLTYSNFVKIKEGMTEQEVIDLLGEPTKITSAAINTGIGSIIGIDQMSGTNMIWIDDESKANVLFFKGKVKSHSYTNQF